MKDEEEFWENFGEEFDEEGFDQEEAEEFARRHQKKSWAKDFRFVLDLTLNGKNTLKLSTWLMLTAAIAYVLCPVDGIPDMIVGIGFMDDAAILSLAVGVAAAGLNERGEGL